MLKKPTIWGIILILLFTSFNSLASNIEDYSNTIYLNDSSISLNSIQEAIDNANDGDTIYISSGVYYEHIVVDKQLTIIGDGSDVTFVDGMGLDEHVFNIVSDNVDISGFTIMNCSIGFSGIRVNNDFCNIHHNIFRFCGGGVELWDVKDIIIHNNTIEDNTWGIYVHNSKDCSINDNTLMNNVYGMEIGYSTIEIKDNLFENNLRFGILQLWSNDVIIEGNNFSGNVKSALQLYSSNENIIHNNIIRFNRDGLSLDESSNNTISENIITGNNYGVYLWFNSNNNNILNNEIYSNGYPIYFRRSNYNNISSNNIINNSNYIIIRFSSGNIFCDNNIINNSKYGIRFVYSNYNIIKQNIIEGKIVDNNLKTNIIQMEYSSNNSIIGNIIKDGFGGMFFEYSSYNNISENKISNITAECIKFKYNCDNNTIYGNYISNNNAHGIYLQLKSNNNIIADNNITSTNSCIVISFSSNNTIIGNNISNSIIYHGIFLNDSSNTNTITNNNISNNNEVGIFIAFSSNKNIIKDNIISKNYMGIAFYSKFNIIKENNIIRNDFNAFFRYSSPNFWFNNYWDDWNKTTPRPIYGEIRLELLNDRIVPWVQFDWKPATEPYDIGGFNE